MSRRRQTLLVAAVCVVGGLLTAPVRAQDDGTGTSDSGSMDFGANDAAAPDASAQSAGAGDAAGEDGSSLDEGISLTLRDRIKAVSRKVFLKDGRFELSPAMAATMNDPFYRTWQVAGRFAYHVNDALGIEVGGNYVPPFFVEKLPPVDLLRQQARLINVDNKLQGMVDVGFTFSPMYGKVAILSDAIVHFDGFVAAGAGAVFDTGEDFVHPALNVGAGMRVFMLRWLVARADLRNYIYPQDIANISTLQNLLVLSVGVGVFFPFDFDYRYEAARVKS